MPKRRTQRRSTRGKKVKLPEPKQSKWKTLAGIGSTVGDKLALLPGPIGLAGRALAGISNLINVEGKFSDVALTLQPDSATGTVTPLMLLAQGSTDSTRNGNSVLAKSIALKGTFVQNTSAVTTMIRIILVLDKQNAQGTAPTLAGILQAADRNAFMNMDNSDRYVILYNEMRPMSLNGDSRISALEIYKDLSDLHVKYDGTAATQANATENHVYLCMISNEATNVPALNGYSRFRYYDN